MSKDGALTLDDLLESVGGDVSKQAYVARTALDGVVLEEIRVHRGPDGAFAEMLRASPDGDVEGLPGFRPVQWNWSVLESGAIKAWHLHLRQDDLWIIPPTTTLLVGLYDLRRGSPTSAKSDRLALGAGACHRLWIPRGVAHGVANLSLHPQTLMYAVNQHFSADPDRGDELRLPVDYLGDDFWQMDRN